MYKFIKYLIFMSVLAVTVNAQTVINSRDIFRTNLFEKTDFLDSYGWIDIGNEAHVGDSLDGRWITIGTNQFFTIHWEIETIDGNTFSSNNITHADSVGYSLRYSVNPYRADTKNYVKSGNTDKLLFLTGAISDTLMDAAWVKSLHSGDDPISLTYAVKFTLRFTSTHLKRENILRARFILLKQS